MPNLVANVRARVQGVLARMMVGYNAGLPQGQFGPGAQNQYTDKPFLQTGAIPLRGEAPVDYQRTGTTVRIRGFERHPVVQACVRAIVDITSAIELEAYALTHETDSGREVIDVLPLSAPVSQLISAPSPFLSPQRLRALTAVHYLIYGNALWFLERPLPATPDAEPKPPNSIRLIHPEDVMTIWVNNRGYPLWYMWRDTLGYTHTSPVTDIVHFRDLNAKGMVFGYPRAASALNDIIGDDEASQFVRQTVTNSGAPLSWALVHDDTTLAEAQAAEAAYYEKMVVRGNRGRFTFLGGVKDIKSTTFNLRDLEFPDLRRVAREDICAAFGVDPRMVGITSATRDAGLSGTQYTEARIRLIQQTVEPMLRYFESELNFWFAPEFGADTYVRFDPDVLKALVEDDDKTSTRIQNEVKVGLRTVEEGREALDLPSEFEDDDTLAVTTTTQFVPTAIAVAGLAITTEAPVGSAPAVPGAPGGAPGAPGVPTGAPGAPGAPIAAPAGTAVPPLLKPGTEEVEPTTDVGAQGRPTTTPAAGFGPLPTSSGTNPNNPLTAPSPTTSAGIGEKVKQTKNRAQVIGGLLVRHTRGVLLTQGQRDELWRQFDERATKEEVAYRRAAMLQFAEERSNVNRIFERHAARSRIRADVITGDAAPSLLPLTQVGKKDKQQIEAARRSLKHMYKPGGEVAQRWADRFRPLIGETFQKGAEHVGSTFPAARRRSESRAGPRKPANKPAGDPKPMGYDFHLSDPEIQQAIQDRSERLAANVGDTTGAAIDDALSIALREGMTIEETAALIDQVAFGLSASQRANTIARTETTGALNQGQHAAALASGWVEGKEWLTENDERVRDSHYGCQDEGVIPVDDVFSNDCMYPGDPDGDPEEVINCRCSLLYYDSLTGATTEANLPDEDF